MNQLSAVYDAIPFSAIFQVAVLYFVIYAILRGAKGSRFGQALAGIGMLAATLIAFSYLFHFEVLSRIIQFLLIYIAVSTVVIFQPEIRRILMTVGAFGSFDRPKHRADGSATPECIVETLMALSKERMGALIAFERGISLRSYERTGVSTDAIFTSELVRSIFTPPLPLHDGGMVMRNGRISSAHCIFPVSNNPDLIEHGMRHRAAVGLSEETDALVAVVSEESGAISIAHNGKISRYEGDGIEGPLLRWISNAMPQDTDNGGMFGSMKTPLRKLLTKLSKGGSR